MKVNQVQLFERGYINRCSTYACGERATKYVGRPDAPLNVSYVLCDKCIDELVQSIRAQYPVETEAASPSVIEDELVEMADDATSPSVNTEGLAEAVADARTHAEVDKVVEKYGLQDIPTKTEGATVQVRKDAILKVLG
ncbi:hypothetical protein [Lysinibacillus sp. F5]|uniref:hypothetical protein n=1 Tax=Lysinibacillus sp. F5 TaxID=1700846 RepID=UPI000738B42E|nr:hypothetical protein [Lysinibacillus sp. F5]KUF37435.1 hypothetical protein AK833_00670 [Lysinibacillus sp. F5]